GRDGEGAEPGCGDEVGGELSCTFEVRGEDLGGQVGGGGGGRERGERRGRVELVGEEVLLAGQPVGEDHQAGHQERGGCVQAGRSWRGVQDVPDAVEVGVTLTVPCVFGEPVVDAGVELFLRGFGVP